MVSKRPPGAYEPGGDRSPRAGGASSRSPRERSPCCSSPPSSPRPPPPPRSPQCGKPGGSPIPHPPPPPPTGRRGNRGSPGAGAHGRSRVGGPPPPPTREVRRRGALPAGTFPGPLLTAVLPAPTHSTLEASMREAQRFVDDATPTATAEPAVEQFEYVEIGQPMTIPGEAVYGVGDSMMYVAAPGLAKKIPGMTINAESNRQWPAVLAELQRVVEEGEVGPVAVIAAGTNAGAQGVSDVEEALEILGPERRV